MLRFVLQKLRGKPWMALSLLIGNILLVAIACANPLYAHAALQRALQADLNAYISQTGRYPGVVSVSASMARNAGGLTHDAFDRAQELAASAAERLGLPQTALISNIYSENANLTPLAQRSDSGSKQANLGFLSDILEHSEIIAGSAPSPELHDGVADVIVSEKALVDLGLMVDEVYALPNRRQPDGSELFVRIAGVYRNSQSQDPYWVREPNAYSRSLFMDEGLFRSLFLHSEDPDILLRGNWYALLDHSVLKSDMAQDCLRGIERLTADAKAAGGVTLTCNLTDTLSSYCESAPQSQATLLVLQAPVFVLLVAFLIMVSGQMLSMEEGEIAVLKSRGASRGQLVYIYFLQALLFCGLSLLAGLPLGAYLCQVLGSANAFLEFVQRRALPIEFDLEVLLYGLAASLISMAAMVLPVLRYAGVSIVDQKRRRQRAVRAPLWQRMFLDLILLGVSLYGFYSFDQQRDQLYLRVLSGGSLDPLLFLSSSLFILGAALLAVRLLPLLVRLVYACFQRFWSPALLASFLRVLRVRGQGFIMVFLIFTVALGMFNSTAAKTVNDNEERALRYSIGADVTLQEVWSGGSGADGNETVYREPDFDRYTQMEGVVSAAKVYINDRTTVSLPGGSKVGSVRLMGIQTKDFGRTAWFDESLLPVHWYNYLNAISQDAGAVLLSENMEDLGFTLGQSISYQDASGEGTGHGVVYGFIPYWPGYASKVRSVGEDGLMHETEQYLIVANLSQVQSDFGVKPYQVWLKMDGSTRPIYEAAEREGLRFGLFHDLSAELVEAKNDPVLQGTNGILTVSFIVVLLLCSVGFLIYWVLSIQSRALQMGIFRAMGMRMREIWVMLLNEQICVSFLSIAAGAGIGRLASYLYVPLIQIAYSSADRVLPLRVTFSPADDLRLFLIVGTVMALCLMLLCLLVSRMKITQALKLGED